METVQTDDWKKEKHVPVLDCPDKVNAGEFFNIRVTLGKEISHPNTTEHHIRWVTLYYLPFGDKFTCEVGHFEFNAHGESIEGPNKGLIFTNHDVTVSIKVLKQGTIYALSYCNIHGLRMSSKEISII